MVFAYLLVCLVFGTTFLGIKVGAEAGGPPFLLAALRFFSAGVLVLLFVWWKKRDAFPRSWQVYGRLFLVGLTMTSVSFGGLYWAEQYIPSNLAAILNATTPVMVGLLSARQQKQRLQGVQWIGLLLGILGVYLIVGGQRVEHTSHQLWFIVLAVIACQAVSACGAMVSRKLMVEGLSPWVVNGFQMSMGSLGLFVLALCKQESLASIHDPVAAFGSLVYLIVIGSMLGWGLYYLLIAKTNPLLPSTWSYVSPMVALGVGALWLNETITGLAVLGGIIVLVGVGLSNWRDWTLLLAQSSLRKAPVREERGNESAH